MDSIEKDLDKKLRDIKKLIEHEGVEIVLNGDSIDVHLHNENVSLDDIIDNYLLNNPLEVETRQFIVTQYVLAHFLRSYVDKAENRTVN